MKDFIDFISKNFSEGCYTDFYAGAFEQGVGAGFEGGAGGDDVVGQQDVFLCVAFGVDEFENVFYVFPTLCFCLPGLGGGVDCAYEISGRKGEGCGLGQSEGDCFGLIVGSFFEFIGMQGYGNDDLDGLDEGASCQVVSEESSQKDADLFFVAVFELVDEWLEHSLF